MDRVKIRIKGAYVKRLSLEQLQGVVLWIYGLFLPGKTRSPSFFSIHNRRSLGSANLIFVSNKQDGLCSYNSCSFLNGMHTEPGRRLFFLKEHISLEEVRNLVLASIDRSRIDHNNTILSRENTRKFLVRNMRLVFSRYEQQMPSSLSLLSVDCSAFMRFTGSTAHWLVSMDCEMVETEAGHEVGRVSIVDHQGSVLYDKCVKPKNPVVDFLTGYSGLDETSLASGVTLERVHDDLQKIIGKDTIILGHSLESDLVALQIYHDKVIDTSHIFLSSDNRRVRLKDLALNYLNTKIQKKQHCSVEDARQCLCLLKYKVEEFNLLEKSDAVLDLNTTINRLRVDTAEVAEREYVEVRYADDLRLFFRDRNLNMILATQRSAAKILEMQRRNPNSVFLYFYEDDKKIHVVI